MAKKFATSFLLWALYINVLANNDILDFSDTSTETRDVVFDNLDSNDLKTDEDQPIKFVDDDSEEFGFSGNSTSNSTETKPASDDVVDYDMYVYDMDESLATYDWYELVPTLAVYTLTLVVGVVGNSLIIFTICRYRRMKSTTNVFLASLASADLLLIAICIPVKLAKLFSYTWTMGQVLCKLVHYMQSVSAVCSVLTLTAMSIERYYAIVHPMRAKYVCTISQARRIILATWFASFLLAVPILFVQVHKSVGSRVKAHWCVKDWDSPAMWKFHELYMLLLILIAPTLVMGVAYSAICWEIFRVMQRRHDMTTGQGLKPVGSRRGAEQIPLRGPSRRHDNNHHPTIRESLKKVNSSKSEEENNTVKQVIKMLVAVVVLFVLCWGPMLIDNVLTAYGVLEHLRTDKYKHMATAFHLMAYFNSCINPVVYGFMSKNFRDSFYKALCRCCHSGRLPKRAMSMSQTRTTSVRYALWSLWFTDLTVTSLWARQQRRPRNTDVGVAGAALHSLPPEDRHRRPSCDNNNITVK